MKKCLQITLLSGLLAFPAAATLAAVATTTTSATTMNGTTSAPAMDMMSLLTQLDAAGYHNIKEIELGSNGTYKVDTIDAQGKKLEFTVDPAKPEIKAQAKDVKVLTASEVAKKVMDAGYTQITKIKYKGDRYDVKAHDKNGKVVKLNVNMVSGEIHKEWF